MDGMSRWARAGPSRCNTTTRSSYSPSGEGTDFLRLLCLVRSPLASAATTHLITASASVFVDLFFSAKLNLLPSRLGLFQFFVRFPSWSMDARQTQGLSSGSRQSIFFWRAQAVELPPNLGNDRSSTLRCSPRRSKQKPSQVPRAARHRSRSSLSTIER